MKKYQSSEGAHKQGNINYSRSMQQMLRSNKLNGVIKKLQNRRINQKLLLLLSVTTINEFSFLDEEEKKELPKAVRKY